ncbi:MAG TPA: MAPEG family protein [Gammaproteobacteria bacterium]|nr:MAPEG family protein [Gammaproteobacteria bacterium]
MQTHTLSPELYWLTLTVLMTGLMWLPYVLNRLIEQGPLAALWDPNGETSTRVPWADRMMRAHQNAVENLVVFAPLVLALQVAGITGSVTVTACIVYFFARLTHYVVFTLGLPVVRVLAFAAGVAAQVMLALVLLGLF